jgi:long-chain acyl-CoA synthetase
MKHGCFLSSNSGILSFIVLSGYNYIPELANESFLATQKIFGHEPSDEEKESAIKKVVDYVNSKTPSYKHIRIVEVLKVALEKTTTRKIKRFGTNLT